MTSEKLVFCWVHPSQQTFILQQAAEWAAHNFAFAFHKQNSLIIARKTSGGKGGGYAKIRIK